MDGQSRLNGLKGGFYLMDDVVEVAIFPSIFKMSSTWSSTTLNRTNGWRRRNEVILQADARQRPQLTGQTRPDGGSSLSPDIQMQVCRVAWSTGYERWAVLVVAKWSAVMHSSISHGLAALQLLNGRYYPGPVFDVALNAGWASVGGLSPDLAENNCIQHHLRSYSSGGWVSRFNRSNKQWIILAPATWVIYLAQEEPVRAGPSRSVRGADVQRKKKDKHSEAGQVIAMPWQIFR
jgi:hypothetical protein